MAVSDNPPVSAPPPHSGKHPPRQRFDVRGLAPTGQDWYWPAVAGSIALVISLPLLAIAWFAVAGHDNIWPHLAATVLPASLTNTLALMLGAGALALAIGTGTAWIVTMHRFPGRSLADRLLVLPLAMPVYIVAYAYVDLLDYAGPIQSWLRTTFGFSSVADYWFPSIKSLGGAILIFALTLYPYVYLAARASFEQQSVCVLEVARTLGRTARETLWSVALPLARPALAAGVALVLMECLNDLGAVQYLGVETLSASVFSTWTQRQSLSGAAQLSLVMMCLVAAIILAERFLRGGGGTQSTTQRFRAIPFETLTGGRATAALALVLLPFLLGFLLPFGILLYRALAHAGDATAFLYAMRNSLILASLVALFAVGVALVLSYAARLGRGPATQIANRFASLGYALPGTVLAIGLLTPLAAIDNGIDGWMRGTFGVSTGLLLSGSLFAVTLALVIRFLAVALGSIEAGLERISRNLDAAARTLGSGSWAALWRVHVPLLLPPIGAAALLVFVDALKELPATLLLRPFNFDTLATHIYALTATEQLEEAALGAIAIVMIAILPVLWLHRAVSEGRAGSGSNR